MKSAYNNIAISGESGVGKNVLFDNLRKELEPRGWHFHKTGDIVRDSLQEYTAPTADMLSYKGNVDIEKRTREILETGDKQVVEAWLAGYIVRDLPYVLKVLLTSDTQISTKRVAKRDHLDLQEAQSIIQKRKETNFKIWQELYHDQDFFNPTYYDLVIDTSDKTPEEICQIVMEKLIFDK